jgi:hypothetical protein
MLNTALILVVLAWSLRLRWDRFKQPDDIKYCVKYLRYLRDHQLRVLNISHNIVSYLVLALTEQVKSTPDNVLENIKEMVIHCRELLNSDSLTSPSTDVFLASINAIHTPYNITRLGEP